MSNIIGVICESLFGHRMKPWEPFEIPEAQSARFEHAQCRICRQWYVRPQPLAVLDWAREATSLQSKPERFDTLDHLR